LRNRARQVQLLVPYPDALITTVQLPRAGARRSKALLAYAVEDQTVSEPSENEVSWLGAAGDADVVSVLDRKQLGLWREALEAAGLSVSSVSSESLLVPRSDQRWSCVLDGREGFVRTGDFEASVTDSGDRDSPPLALCLLVEAARARDALPQGVDVYARAPEAKPDFEAWQRTLGVQVRPAPHWDWRTASEAGPNVANIRARWTLPSGVARKLRPAALIAGAAIALHVFASVADWARLAAEQRSLRAQMEARFRSMFPDALAVADPALQMRRKLAEARRAANQPDDGDFSVMVARIAPALKALPAGSVRTLSYENGRITLEIADDGSDLASRISKQLAQAGLKVTTLPPAGGGRRTIALSVTVA
jgi:general secretion pathway protein L